MSQTKPLSPDSQAIFDIAKSANDAYLVAFRNGYESGWTAAMKHAIEIMSKPPEMKSNESNKTPGPR